MGHGYLLLPYWFSLYLTIFRDSKLIFVLDKSLFWILSPVKWLATTVFIASFPSRSLGILVADSIFCELFYRLKIELSSALLQTEFRRSVVHLRNLLVEIALPSCIKQYSLKIIWLIVFLSEGFPQGLIERKQ